MMGEGIKCRSGGFEEILRFELVSRKTDGRELKSLTYTARSKNDHLQNGFLHKETKNGDITPVSEGIVALGCPTHICIGGLIHVFCSGDAAANTVRVGKKLLRLFGRPKTPRIARARTGGERG